MKLWHDDIRRPPDGSWTWARTNEEARRLLNEHPVHELSLDHDLGAHDYDPDAPDAVLVRGGAAETGYDLVRWMLSEGRVPPVLTVHSWNSAGAKRMAAALREGGHACVIRPYRVPLNP